MRIFYFNPYNDLALAAPTGHFTPPASALAVERAGACLPLWWASESDIVLVPDESSLAMARHISAKFGLPNVASLKVQADTTGELHPWGWSRHAAGLFARAGVRTELLPSPRWLEEMRQLSHRRTSIGVLHRLGLPAELMPIEARSVNEAMERYRRWDKAVMKLPWSGSGRGVMLAHEIPDATLRGYIEGVIRRQGSIIVEPFYHRRLDFAMLFEIGEEVNYAGVSVFAADSRGRYTGNIVAPQSELESMIPADLTILRRSMADALRPIADAGYRGPCGVDMMVYDPADGREPAVMPCIEVNLRWTMGIAAMLLARHGLRGELRFSLRPNGQTVSGNGPCFNIE
ncbi:MAG: hypothetical protein K2K79_00510 [Paramuribaculum sp.]|nr:hypothetical protein [Paramuribaculum sp.]